MIQFKLDDMYVIDSAGEYSVSGDDGEPTNAAGDRRASAKKHPASSDARRRKDFELFLSYLRSVDCNFQEVVSTLPLLRINAGRLLITAALCNRAGHYIFVLWFLLLSSSFFLA